MNTVTLSVASRDDVTRRTLAAFEGKARGAHHSFASPDLLWQTLTRKRWDLIQAMTGQGVMSIREAARRVERDVKAVHGDVQALIHAGVIHRTEQGKHIQFAGVQIVTLAEGEISELDVGLKGTMNALFLKDLAKKTHRGLRGCVEKGKAGGGLCYGYDVVKRLGGDDEPVRGERSINDAEAAIVRRTFRDFAAGLSPLAIARDLNAMGIPGQPSDCGARRHFAATSSAARA